MNSVPGRHVSEETLSANPLDCGAGRSTKLNESAGGAGCPLSGGTPAPLFRRPRSGQEGGAVSGIPRPAKRPLTVAFPRLLVRRPRGCGRGGIRNRGVGGSARPGNAFFRSPWSGMDGARRGREVAGDGTDAAQAARTGAIVPGTVSRPTTVGRGGREDEIGGFGGGGPGPVGEGDFTVRARVRARETRRRRG